MVLGSGEAAGLSLQIVGSGVLEVLGSHLILGFSRGVDYFKGGSSASEPSKGILLHRGRNKSGFLKGGEDSKENYVE